MKFFIKLVLLVCVIFFALFNYRIVSFNKGFSKQSFEDKSILEVLTTLTGITRVEYYSKTIPSGDFKYRVYIVTNDDAYLLNATQSDIDAFNTLGIFSNKLKPNKVTPIPFYVEIIVGIVILVIPFGKRKKLSTKTEE